jgi:hypothetical protein
MQATWEVEIERMVVQGQPGEKDSIITNKAVWWHMPVTQATWKAWEKDGRLRLIPAKMQDLI